MSYSDNNEKTQVWKERALTAVFCLFSAAGAYGVFDANPESSANQKRFDEKYPLAAQIDTSRSVENVLIKHGGDVAMDYAKKRAEIKLLRTSQACSALAFLGCGIAAAQRLRNGHGRKKSFDIVM